MYLNDKKWLVLVIVLIDTTMITNLNGAELDSELLPSPLSSLKRMQKRENLTHDSLQYMLELYLKYYELIQDNIFQNAAQKKKALYNFKVLKNKLLYFMNQSEKNRNLMYKLLVKLVGKNKKGK